MWFIQKGAICSPFIVPYVIFLKFRSFALIFTAESELTISRSMVVAKRNLLQTILEDH